MHSLNLDYYANSLLGLAEPHEDYFKKYQPNFQRLNELQETLAKSKARIVRQLEELDITEGEIIEYEQYLSTVRSLAVSQKKLILKQILLDISDNLKNSSKGIVKSPRRLKKLYRHLFYLNLKIQRELLTDEFSFINSIATSLKNDIEKKLKFLAIYLRKYTDTSN